MCHATQMGTNECTKNTCAVWRDQTKVLWVSEELFVCFGYPKVVPSFPDSCVLAITVVTQPCLSNGCVCQSGLWIHHQHWHHKTARGPEQCESQQSYLEINPGSVSLCITFLFPQLGSITRGLAVRDDRRFITHPENGSFCFYGFFFLNTLNYNACRFVLLLFS